MSAPISVCHNDVFGQRRLAGHFLGFADGPDVFFADRLCTRDPHHSVPTAYWSYDLLTLQSADSVNNLNIDKS